MQPLKLEIENFRSFHHRTIIDFEKHFNNHDLFLISGKTGSGKSSILDAMTYALYNKTASGLTRKDILSHWYNKGEKAEVIFTFKANEIYTIKRSFSSTGKFALYKEEELIATQEKEISQYIQQIIGLDYKQFTKVICLPQGKLEEFLQAKPSEKKELLSSIFQLDDLEHVKNIIKHHVNENKDQLNHLEGRIKEVLSLFDKESPFCLEFDAYIKTFEYDGKKLKKQFEAYIDEISDNIQLETNKIEELTHKIEEQESKIKHQEAINDAIVKKEQLETDKNKLTQKEQEIEKIKEKVDQIDRWNALGIFDLNTQCQHEQDHLKIAKKKKEEIEALMHQIELEEKISIQRQQNIKIQEEKIIVEKEKVEQLNIEKQLVEEINNIQQEQKKLEQDIHHLKQQVIQNQEKSLKVEDFREKIQNQQYIIESLEKDKIKQQEKEEAFKEWEIFQNAINEKEEQIRFYNLKLNQVKALITSKQGEYHRVQQLYNQQAASRLAKDLIEGESCPVCGSKHHPQKAQAGDEISDQIIKTIHEEIQSLEKQEIEISDQLEKYKQQQTEKLQQQANLGLNIQSNNEAEHYKIKLNEHYQHLMKQLLTEKEKNKQLESAYQVSLEAKEKVKELEEALSVKSLELAKYDTQQQDRQQQRNFLTLSLMGIQEKFDYHQNNYVQLDQTLDALKKDEDAYQQKKQEITVQYSERVQYYKQQQKKNEALQQKYNKLLITHHIDNKEVENLDKERASYIKWRQTLENYYQKLTQMNTLIQELEVQIGTQVFKILDDDKKQLEKDKEQQLFLHQQCAQWTNELENIQVNGKHLQKISEDYMIIQKKLKQWSLLLSLWDKRGKTSIEDFIIGHYFNSMIYHANYYLKQFSNASYLLKQDEEHPMELLVQDGFLNQRSVKTLSGGEKFMCTLSLSLGMSDVIGSTHGGIKTDSLFIDEGFGSLDEESIDEALSLLNRLQSMHVSGTIGIISHMIPLKESINKQILVDKNNSGSHIQFIEY